MQSFVEFEDMCEGTVLKREENEEDRFIREHSSKVDIHLEYECSMPEVSINCRAMRK